MAPSAARLSFETTFTGDSEGRAQDLARPPGVATPLVSRAHCTDINRACRARSAVRTTRVEDANLR